jgi:Flp pilus assembly pilin Flp
MRLINHKKGQSTAEYAILISLVVAVLVGVQIYVKRGIQGRFKDATDDYVSQLTTNKDWAFTGAATAPTVESQWEFDKYSAQRTRATLAGTETTEVTDEGGKVTRDITEKSASKAGDYNKYDYTK